MSHIRYDREFLVARVISVQTDRFLSLTHKAAARTITGTEKVVLLLVPDLAELYVAGFLGVLLTCNLATSDPSAPGDITAEDKSIRVCVVMGLMEFL